MEETIFDKLGTVRQLLKSGFINYDEEYIVKLLSRINKRWLYNKNKKKVKLSSDELKLYELLVKHKYHPQSVYKWFLLDKAPAEVRDMLKFGEIGLREAFKMKNQINSLYKIDANSFRREVILLIEECIM